ncbi:MAG: hypothetical protein HYU42_01720 [Candidatus Rokubacteria bacterium]|nr:hypothetical protein [Candidatus Rokubacteria bacterium]
MNAPSVRALGLISGWGDGVEAIPADATSAAAGRPLLSLGRPPVEGERFRRATRECLWALAVVERMLEDGRAEREAIAGEGTALLFVTAAGYAASNRAFIEGSGGGTHFAYTAPAVVPAEVAIEFGVRGPSAIFIGGPPATLLAIWHAATLLDRRVCDRAIVLAVETFEECADLYARGPRWTVRPLVETAAALWLERGHGTLALDGGRVGRGRGMAGRASRLRERLGDTFACEPLAAVGLWRREAAADTLVLDGAWQGETAHLMWQKGAG